MRNNYLILCSCIFLFAGCNKNNAYNKFKALSPDVEWRRDLKVSFNPEIKNDSIPYDIFFVLNHHTSYPYQNCIIKVTQIPPSGKTTFKDYTLNIKGKDGKLLGKGAGDYWDLEEKVENNYFFKEQGKYTFIVEHKMPRNILTHVFRLGLIIKKSE